MPSPLPPPPKKKKKNLARFECASGKGPVHVLGNTVVMLDAMSEMDSDEEDLDMDDDDEDDEDFEADEDEEDSDDSDADRQFSAFGCRCSCSTCSCPLLLKTVGSAMRHSPLPPPLTLTPLFLSCLLACSHVQCHASQTLLVRMRTTRTTRRRHLSLSSLLASDRLQLRPRARRWAAFLPHASFLFKTQSAGGEAFNHFPLHPFAFPMCC